MASPRGHSVDFVVLLLLGLMSVVAVSHAGIAAGRSVEDEMAEFEIRKSFAWRRQLRETTRMRGLLQADDETSVQGDKNVGKLQADREKMAGDQFEPEGNEEDRPFEQPRSDVEDGVQAEPRGSPIRMTRALRKTKPFKLPGKPYLLAPPIKDWDEQRGAWLEANPQFKQTPGGKPRVLIITGSPPKPCKSDVGDDFHVRSLKLKLDYARMHNFELYYNFAWLDPNFKGVWIKLPIIRKLLVTHPEIEWFFWIDADAVFTDMLFEPPFHLYDDYNMIIWAWQQGLFNERRWVATNSGSFLVRNCQWTLDLLDKWSPFGFEDTRQEYGHLVNSYMSDRLDTDNSGDQPPLAYLIAVDEAVRSKTMMIEDTDYRISGWWVGTVTKFDDSLEKYHPNLGDWRCPYVTHFTGCSPCGGGNNKDYSSFEDCMGNFTRAYNFADNQVLAYMGFQHESLLSDKLVRIRNETDRPIDFVDVNPWEERMAQVAAGDASKSKW